MYVSFIELRLNKTSLTLINRTRLRTKGQSAGYPQAQIGINSNSFQRRAPYAGGRINLFELKIERSFRRAFLGEEFSGEALLAYNLFQVIGCGEDS